MNQVLLSDACVCIDLYEGGLLKYLPKLPFSFSILDLVLEEITSFEKSVISKSGFEVQTLEGNDFFHIADLYKKYTNPSFQDVASLYYAKQNDIVLLTNDKALRRASASESVEYHGTLWILDKFFEHSILNGKTLTISLQNIIKAGSHLPKNECTFRFNTWK